MPKQTEEDEEQAPVTDLFAADDGGSDSGDGSGEGTLIYCPNCNTTRMQKNPDICEKCGMILHENIHNGSSPSVPAFNPYADDGTGIQTNLFGSFQNPAINGNGGGMPGLSSGGMESVGGSMGSIGRNSNDADRSPNKERSGESPDNMFNQSSGGIDALAGFSANATEGLASIDGPTHNNRVHQKEPEKGEERKVEDFAMNDALDMDDIERINGGAVNVIDGCSMDEDKSKDVDLDPYKFLNTGMDDMLAEEPAKPQEPEKSAQAQTPPTGSSVPADSSGEGEVVFCPNCGTRGQKGNFFCENCGFALRGDPAPAASAAPEPVTPIIEPVTPPITAIEPPVTAANDTRAATEPITPVMPVPPISEIPEPVSVTAAPVEPIAPIADTPAPVPVPPVSDAGKTELVTDTSPITPIPPIAEISAPVPPVSDAGKTEFVTDTSSVTPIPPIAEISAPVPPVSDAGKTELVSDTSPVTPIPPIAEISAAEAPAKSPKAAEPVSGKQKPAPMPVDDFIPEEIGFIAETRSTPPNSANNVQQSGGGAPTVLLTPPVQNTAQTPPPTLNRPNAPQAGNAPDPSKGNLVYCRNCGQDMYDTEKVCKNCGAPYKGAYVPPRNAPSKSSSSGAKNQGEAKKIFGIFAPSTFAGLVVVAVMIVALIVFIAVRSSGYKVPVINNTDSSVGGESAPVSSASASASVSTPSSSTPQQSSDTSSDNNSEPVESSADDPNSSQPDNTSSDSGNSSQSVQSSATPQSSSRPQSSRPQSSTPQSSSKPQSSSQSSSGSAMSAKVKSLENDRARMMQAIENIAGEMGKIDALSRHISYELDHSGITAEATIKNFYSGSIGTSLLNSIKNSRLTLISALNIPAPANSELTSVYNAYNQLKTRYNDCFSIINDPGDYRTYRQRLNTAVSAYNSQLSSLSFSKFMTSSYTAANKDLVYATMLRSAQSAINSSSTAFTSVQSSVSKIGKGRYEEEARNAIGGTNYTSALSYIGKVNAYRLMLLGGQSTYSGSFSELSSAYNALIQCLTYQTQVPDTPFNDYNTYTVINANTAKSSATKIGNAIAKAF